MCPPCWSLLRHNHHPQVDPSLPKVGWATDSSQNFDGWVSWWRANWLPIIGNHWQPLTARQPIVERQRRRPLETFSHNQYAKYSHKCRCQLQNNIIIHITKKARSGAATNSIRSVIWTWPTSALGWREAKHFALEEDASEGGGVSISNGSSPHYIREKD